MRKITLLLIASVVVAGLFINSMKGDSIQQAIITKPTILSTYLSRDIVIISEKIWVDIFTPEEISITETFVFQNIGNNSITTISFWENKTAGSFLLSDPEGIIDFNWEPFSNSTHLLTAMLRYPLLPNTTTTITCTYSFLTELPYQTKDGEISYYSLEFQPSVSYSTNTMEVKVILPQKTFLHEEDDSVTPFYPNNATQSVYHNRIIVLWTFDNLSALSNPLFLLRFDAKPIVKPDEAIFTFSFNVFLFGFVIGLFIGISGTFWLIRYREKRAKSELGKSLLNENQIKLIKLIYEHGGKLSQRELCDITGFSKSKVSRNLVPLESRGLISREKWGRTYVVYLTENGKEVIEQ